jgi:hypothetical protein
VLNDAVLSNCRMGKVGGREVESLARRLAFRHINEFE